jgi:hypothetical protein
MKTTEFCYWLQGYFEIGDGRDLTLDAEQVKCIRRHLALVFQHDIDPSYTAGLPPKEAAKAQADLHMIHGPGNELIRC